MPKPTVKGATKRDPNTGRWLPGTRGGPGNPFAARTAALRSSLLEAITPDAMRRITLRMIEMATEGDVAAAKVIMERAVGKPIEPDLIERIERLEEEMELRN